MIIKSHKFRGFLLPRIIILVMKSALMVSLWTYFWKRTFLFNMNANIFSVWQPSSFISIKKVKSKLFLWKCSKDFLKLPTVIGEDILSWQHQASDFKISQFACNLRLRWPQFIISRSCVSQTKIAIGAACHMVRN